MTTSALCADFDCEKSLSVHETTICKDRFLSAQNNRLGESFKAMQTVYPYLKDKEQEKQRLWLIARDKACQAEDIKCLSEAYINRNKDLDAQLLAATPPICKRYFSQNINLDKYKIRRQTLREDQARAFNFDTKGNGYHALYSYPPHVNFAAIVSYQGTARCRNDTYYHFDKANRPLEIKFQLPSPVKETACGETESSFYLFEGYPVHVDKQGNDWDVFINKHNIWIPACKITQTKTGRVLSPLFWEKERI